MATAAKPITYAHIVKRDGYCGGKAAIDNTRVRVNNVAFLHKQGLTPEQILVEYPDLSLAQAHAALTYYYDHRDEIDAELAAEVGAEERFEKAKAEYLSRGHPSSGRPLPPVHGR
jgi:uncharacterized protein (DUF433 family)